MPDYDSLAYALDYHDHGLAPIALPYGTKWERRRWSQYYDRQPTTAELHAMFGDGHDHNIAVVAGRASRNAFCIDADTLPTYEEWHRRLMGLGLDAWTVRHEPTGGDHDGGGHFWLRAPVPVQTHAFDGYEVRGQEAYALAPRSLHPGGQVYMTAWGHPARIPELDRLDAIPDLRLQEAEPRPKPSRHAWRLLKGDANAIARYDTRSEAEAALCVSLLNSGHTYHDAVRLFNTYPAAGKYRELSLTDPTNALRWLRMTWENARTWAEAHVSEPVQLAQELQAWANDRPWPGRTGATDRAVYLAHLALVQRCGRTVYGASCREIAELAGTSHVTANHATRRLQDDHELLMLVEQAVATLSARYSLIEPDDLERTYLYTHYNPHVRECKGMSTDAFRWAGLGKTGCQVYTVLHERGRLTVAELATMTGRCRRTVKRKLAAMEELNLVTPFRDGEWMPSELGSLQEAAEALGTDGAGERQRDRHERQRALHRLELRE